MEAIEWAFFESFARVRLNILPNVVARFAKMSISPTKPLSNRATEFALELDIISTMLRTILDSCPYTYSRTFTAH
jgi:hypothetical protein